MIDNFKDYPTTIGEARSDRTDSSSDWTPRDALITLLRRIDNGLVVSELVISYEEKIEDQYVTHYLTASTRNNALGLLARVSWLLNQS